MAYPAIVSLSQTIDEILNHGQYSISSDVKQHIISLQKLVLSLQASLDVFPENAKSLEGQIRDLGNEAEDIIEYLMLELVSSSHGVVPECDPSGKYEHQLKKVMKEMESIAGEVTEIKDSFRSKDVQPGAGSSGPSAAASIHKDVVVGFEDDMLAIKGRLCGEPSRLQVIPIYGMGGIGKTTLAQNVYDDSLTVNHFDIRVWVTISQEYSVEKILSSILDSMKEFDSERLGKKYEEKIHKILKGRRYVVVMDDIWSVEAWDAVRNVFPDDGNGSRIILTTRLSDVASYPDPSSDRHEIRLMDADLSWDLLKKKVFSNEACPSELEIIGKEIARSCKGLPLAIVVIAGVLSTVGKNPASWKEISDNVKSADKGQIEVILSLSYTHLPQYLRPCFLYMGLFPEDHEIRVSKLTKLWVAEGFLKHPNGSRTLEDEAEACLEDLIKRSLALVTKRKWDGRVKSCRLHDLMRDLCIRKAYESKFSLNLIGKNVEKESLKEETKNQRRLSVDPHSLELLLSTHGSNIHTILLPKYDVVVLDFVESVRLLRVLDAEPADVDSLPSQLFELFHLRYLACRYDFWIPRTISKLQNLQTLIIHKEKQDHSFVGVPVERNMVEIWKMPQLRHLYSQVIIGLYEEGNTPLQNLQTLSILSHTSCTERIFRMIPNLKKLVIDCSSFYIPGPKDDLDDLVHLHQLEDLEINGGRRIEFRPIGYSLTFPMMLRKLTLRSMKLPWGEMTTIVGSLPNLQVLKIRGLTGAGETWETLDGGFLKLEVLVVEGSNLQYWITESDHFPILRRLVLHHCPLHEIPQGIGEIPTLEFIEVKGEMKKSLEESLTQIVEEQQSYGNEDFQVRMG